MSDTEQLERMLRAAARDLPYPPTPDLAAAGLPRRRPATSSGRMLRAAALIAALLLAVLLAVPEARAAALRLIQLGVVRVRVEPPPASPLPTPAPPAALNGLSGATTLAAASDQVGFPIRLPAYPADLGPPDHVFLQDLDGAALILIWLDPDDPSRIRIGLHALSSNVFVEKTVASAETERLAETTVGGTRALWVRGPHLLEVAGAGRDDLALRRLVPGNTLIWQRDGLTYRLESELDLEEAIRVAESLR